MSILISRIERVRFLNLKNKKLKLNFCNKKSKKERYYNGLNKYKNKKVIYYNLNKHKSREIIIKTCSLK